MDRMKKDGRIGKTPRLKGKVLQNRYQFWVALCLVLLCCSYLYKIITAVHQKGKYGDHV